jgi:hypothetical protein
MTAHKRTAEKGNMSARKESASARESPEKTYKNVKRNN